jgi:hypothetical protein
VYGILTSGRPVDVLIGPAGTGKSRTMGTLSHLWRQLTGGNVIGVAVAENAAQVLAAEGLGGACNIAMFLTLSSTRQLLGPGDLLVVDEASMVTTGQLTALHQLTAAAGAKLLLTGDPAQLQAIGAGGAPAMIARQHGCYQLTVVQRMTEPWERDASLRLRAGDATVLADYDRHGRLLEGTAEQMETAAYRAWLADYLDGKDSLLIAQTKEQAAGLSRRARADLISAGLVQRGGLTLGDSSTAGVGDLVQARRNDRSIRDHDGRWIANRDVWRIRAVRRSPLSGKKVVVVQRDLGRDAGPGSRAWGAAFEVPLQYFKDHVVLAYATTVHAAEGRTVDTCHALTGPGLSRALLYVALSRGRHANHAYVITELPAADLRPGAAPSRSVAQADPGHRVPGRASEHAGPGQRGLWAPPADRLSVLAAALERDDAEPPALDVLRAELARAGHLAHLGAIWADLAGRAAAACCDAIVSRELGTADQRSYARSQARAALHRQVRAAELAGHDPAALLSRAVRLRPLDSTCGLGRAEDVARVLHSRVRELAGPDAPRPATYAERTPPAGDPQIDRYLHELAALMDQRTIDLGERAAADPPGWALEHLGPVPEDPLQRHEWAVRAGTAAAYRERHGRTDPRDAIGREPAAPEARADWSAARAALGIPRRQAQVAAASTGELWARRARYERELAWAPAHVSDDLRATALTQREHATQATLLRARPHRHRISARRASRPRPSPPAARRQPRTPRSDPVRHRHPARSLARRPGTRARRRA